MGWTELVTLWNNLEFSHLQPFLCHHYTGAKVTNFFVLLMSRTFPPIPLTKLQPEMWACLFTCQLFWLMLFLLNSEQFFSFYIYYWRLWLSFHNLRIKCPEHCLILSKSPNLGINNPQTNTSYVTVIFIVCSYLVRNWKSPGIMWSKVKKKMSVQI